MEEEKIECTGKCYFVLLLALFQFMECGILLIVMLKCKVQGFFAYVLLDLILVMLCSIAIYFLVRKFGRKFVYEFCDESKVSKIENSKLFQNPKKIEMIMLILFLIPGTPKDLLVYIAGILPIKPIRFILISTFGRLPSVISSTLAGENLAIGDWKMSILLYGVVILIAIFIIFVFQKFDKEKTTQEALKTIK